MKPLLRANKKFWRGAPGAFKMFEKNTLSLTKVTGTKKWRLQNEFYFQIDGDYGYSVPKGFVTDLASTPRFAWMVFPKSGIYTEAAVIHDFLYMEGIIKRKKCDQIFKKLLRYCGVGVIRTNLMYQAVRLGGSSSYKG